MIEKYKRISIIYGGSGANYAKELDNLIKEYQQTHRYPISSSIVMESILTNDILSEVSSLFRETEICVAFLTAEDCCVRGEDHIYRLRQNVVFELGMALFHLGRERCILLGDFANSQNKVELPSDMFGLDIKFFNEETKPLVFDQVLKKILHLSLTTVGTDNDVLQYNNLLRRSKYYVDYKRLFSRHDVSIGSNNNDYLMCLIDEWLTECKGLKHFDERIIYVFERIAFLPIFGKKAPVANWHNIIEDIVGSFTEQDIDYYSDRQLLQYAQNVLSVVNTYSKFKMVDGINPTNSDYEDLLFNLKLTQPPINQDINPLISVLYYDYLGLIHMRLYNHNHDVSELLNAKSCYEKIIEHYLDKVDLGLNVWGGFLYYNLARLYQRLNQAQPDAIPADVVENTYLRAISIRKKWLSINGLNSMVLNALSYEYFIAKIDYIHYLQLNGSKSKEYIKAEYQKIEGEIESYCNSDNQLERLVFVQEKLRDARRDMT